ncbi:MAG: HD domain-containing protein [bacterium]|nr:HD domain-containing protein [bacterium]
MSLRTNNIDIADPLLLRIGALAQESQTRIYVVGGFVRDALMGRANTDVDITVVGDPLEFADRVATLFRTKAIHYERFRTALVPVGERNVEFVGTRLERYDADSRKPIVTEGTLEDDLRRRDFTVNAMAASLHADNLGEIIDLWHGAEDLEAKVLRTPLDPIVTMEDDPLRMMRAARFAAQLDFVVDEKTLRAIQSMAERIKIVSQERITDEFMKILASPRPSVGLMILHETGLLAHIFPEVEALAGVDLVRVGEREYRHKDVFRHTLQVVDNVSAMSDNVWLRFATLMHDIAKPRTKRFVQGTGWTFHGHEEVGARWQDKIFRRMKLPLQHLEYVQNLVRLHQRPMKLVDDGVTDSAIRRLAVHAGDAIEDLFMLCRADVTTKNPRLAEKYVHNYDIVRDKVLDVQERDHLRAFQSPVRGEEIMEITGLPPSRTIGYLKFMIEEAILEGTINNEYEAAKEFLVANLQGWLAQADAASFSRRGTTS